MAKSTYGALNRITKQECGCVGNNWDQAWDSIINRFAELGQNPIRARLFDIEGGLGGPLGHYYREAFDPKDFSMADNNTRRAWWYFTGQVPMPVDFFLDFYDSPDGPIYAPMQTISASDGGECGC